jgi:hypothetical protein
MKILRLFVTENKTYEFEDETTSTVQSLSYEEDKLVMHRGGLWEWTTYDDKQTPVTMTYTEVEYTHVSSNITTIGPKEPKALGCQCGSEKLGHPGHSSWCDVLAKNGWDEAVADFLAAKATKAFADSEIDFSSPILFGSYNYSYKPYIP